MSKTTALHLSAGLASAVYASEGAVAQDGRLKVMACNECGGEVVWATSKRTGRMYLVNVRRGHLDQRFYAKHDGHRCEDRHEVTRQIEEARPVSDHGDRCQKTQVRLLARYPEIDVARLDAAVRASVESGTWDALDDLEDEMMAMAVHAARS